MALGLALLLPHLDHLAERSQSMVASPPSEYFTFIRSEG